VSQPNFLDWRSQSRAFESLAATTNFGFTWIAVTADPLRDDRPAMTINNEIGTAFAGRIFVAASGVAGFRIYATRSIDNGESYFDAAPISDAAEPGPTSAGEQDFGVDLSTGPGSMALSTNAYATWRCPESCGICLTQPREGVLRCLPSPRSTILGQLWTSNLTLEA